MTHFLIAGSTGLIGQALAQELNGAHTNVTLITRKHLTPPHPHQQILMTDFSELVLPPATSPSDAVFCALGTTIKKAGSKAAFEAVDLHLVMQLASAAKKAGFRRFGVISSTGAHHKSRNFYLKTKASMEQSLQEIGFDHLVILRPSLLLGERVEFRLGEKFAEKSFKLLGPLFIGPLKRYRPVHARDVAKKLVARTQTTNQAITIVESEAI